MGSETATGDVLGVFGDRKAASPMMKQLIASGREVGCLWTGELVPKEVLSVSLWLHR